MSARRAANQEPEAGHELSAGRAARIPPVRDDVRAAPYTMASLSGNRRRERGESRRLEQGRRGIAEDLRRLDDGDDIFPSLDETRERRHKRVLRNGPVEEERGRRPSLGMDLLHQVAEPPELVRIPSQVREDGEIEVARFGRVRQASPLRLSLTSLADARR